MKRETTTHFFYQNAKLVTVSQPGQHHAIFRNADVPLAEHITGQDSGLLQVDRSGSVLGVSTDSDEEEPHCYSAYGYDPSQPFARTTTRFNGERLDVVAAAYLLGNGYRLFSPGLMRFISPDSWSPFGRGGLNAYAYCSADPINHTDPSGHGFPFLPNGQFMRIQGDKAGAAAHWLKPTPLKKTTSLESVVKAAPPPLPSGATNGKAGWPDHPVATSTGPVAKPVARPVARVSPNQAPPAASPARHLREPSPDASSSDPSRDSTPAQSRSSSPVRAPVQPDPARALQQPYAVLVRHGSYHILYNSRTFDRF